MSNQGRYVENRAGGVFMSGIRSELMDIAKDTRRPARVETGEIVWWEEWVGSQVMDRPALVVGNLGKGKARIMTVDDKKGHTVWIRSLFIRTVEGVS